ncbi:MAG TPA: BON domain-containing protein [Candidatus Sulfomarinibacteraceae bacterium]|nr:BON domain-containing protein [Candidatus Sulfomarinibacteraceae bacterium]
MTADLQRVSRPLMLVVVAAMVATLGACADRERTVEPAGEVPPAEAEGTVEEAVDQLTLPLEIRMALLEELGVDGLRITTTVTYDQVTLGGTVRDPASQMRAEEVVAGLDEVDSVYNTIVVVPTEEMAGPEGAAEELQSEVGDELLEAEVALRLYAAIGADASGIEVEATDGTVSLGGKVDEEHEKTEALAAAREAAGVVDVVDWIEVHPPLDQPF